MIVVDQAAFASALSIQQLSSDEIACVCGAVDWGGVAQGVATTASGAAAVTAGVAIAGGSGGTASILGVIVAVAGGVAVIAGVAQVIEAAS